MQILKLPALSDDGQAFLKFTLNKKEYNFCFCMCGTFILIDIYLSGEKENIYLVKSFPLAFKTDIISRVKNPELITGRLYFRNIYGEDLQPEKSNFATDYELVYFEQEEAAEE